MYTIILSYHLIRYFLIIIFYHIIFSCIMLYHLSHPHSSCWPPELTSSSQVPRSLRARGPTGTVRWALWWVGSQRGSLGPWGHDRNTLGKPWENRGKTIGKWWFHVILWYFMIFYPLVMTNSCYWKRPFVVSFPCENDDFPWSCYMLVYQRVISRGIFVWVWNRSLFGKSLELAWIGNSSCFRAVICLKKKITIELRKWIGWVASECGWYPRVGKERYCFVIYPKWCESMCCLQELRTNPALHGATWNPNETYLMLV